MNKHYQPLTWMALSLVAAIAACGKPSPPADAPAASPAPAATSSIAATVPATTPAHAAMAVEVTVPMHLVDDKGIGAVVGTVMLSEGASGLVLRTDLSGLPPGEHGFHVHQNPDCGPKQKDGKMLPGEAAGEHYDPAGQGKHAGPDGVGHAGDLPRLMVSPDGSASQTLNASKLKLADLKNRSLMIHAERDDYAAMPGGARIACGIVP